MGQGRAHAATNHHIATQEDHQRPAPFRPRRTGGDKNPSRVLLGETTTTGGSLSRGSPLALGPLGYSD